MDLKPAIELIKEFEGLRLTAYQCSARVWTIGYGTTVYPNGVRVKPGDSCTKAQAEKWLASSVAQFHKDVTALVRVPLTNNQLCALVSFTYNVGTTSLRNSTLLRRINMKQFTLAAAEFKRWNRSNGAVTPGLTRRRKAEEELFLKA